MPPPADPPGCPAGKRACPLLSELLQLREECRQLRELSQLDALTGLYNRIYLMTALAQEMERTRRTGLPTSLIMLDLDHFKYINDTLGHLCGDEALRRVGVLLKGHLRRLDIPCRYGGEEFALVLPGTRLSQAVRLAFRLRDLLACGWQDLPLLGGRLTASFGVDSHTGRQEISPEAFLHQVDQWLLLAKAQGRNTVCHPGCRQASEVGLTTEERRALFGVGNPHHGRTGDSYG
ncbi:MAG: GGDEF domain-containing protein [Desulfobaccales bacterium]